MAGLMVEELLETGLLSIRLCKIRDVKTYSRRWAHIERSESEGLVCCGILFVRMVVERGRVNNGRRHAPN
jgi:hypothetical protein